MGVADRKGHGSESGTASETAVTQEPTKVVVADDLFPSGTSQESTRTVAAAELRRLASASMPAPASPSAPVRPAADVWFVEVEDKELGPFTVDQLAQMWTAGKIGSTTLCCKEGMTEWILLSRAQLPFTQPRSMPRAEPSEHRWIAAPRPDRGSMSNAVIPSLASLTTPEFSAAIPSLASIPSPESLPLPELASLADFRPPPDPGDFTSPNLESDSSPGLAQVDGPGVGSFVSTPSASALSRQRAQEALAKVGPKLVPLLGVTNLAVIVLAVAMVYVLVRLSGTPAVVQAPPEAPAPVPVATAAVPAPSPTPPAPVQGSIAAPAQAPAAPAAPPRAPLAPPKASTRHKSRSATQSSPRPASELTAVVVSHRDDLVRCAEKQRSDQPGVNGTLVMQWVILANGRTANVAVASKEFANTPMARCVSGLIKGWGFPAHKTQSEPVKFPFKF